MLHVCVTWNVPSTTMAFAIIYSNELFGAWKLGKMPNTKTRHIPMTNNKIQIVCFVAAGIQFWKKNERFVWQHCWTENRIRKEFGWWYSATKVSFCDTIFVFDNVVIIMWMIFFSFLLSHTMFIIRPQDRRSSYEREKKSNKMHFVSFARISNKHRVFLMQTAYCCVCFESLNLFCLAVFSHSNVNAVFVVISSFFALLFFIAIAPNSKFFFK